MRKSGLSVDEIGDQLDRTPGWVSQAIKRELNENKVDNVDGYRTLHLLRLERLLMAAWAPAMNGDARSIAVSATLLRSISDLLGLDAPLKVDVRAIIEQMADAEGLSDEQKGQAIVEADRIIRAFYNQPKSR